MNSQGPMPIFDGHNDALLRLWKRGGPDAPRAFLDGEGKGQLDLPMAACSQSSCRRRRTS